MLVNLRPTVLFDATRRRVRRSAILGALWSRVRSAQMDGRIRAEQRYYEGEASRRGLVAPDPDSIRSLVRARLARRGLAPVARPKGALRLIYASNLGKNNWEPYQIPKALARFGEVFVFSADQQGFDPDRADWLNHRLAFENALLDFVEQHRRAGPIDALITYYGGWHVSPEAIRTVGDRGIVTAGFSWDDRPSFRMGKAGGRWIGPAALAGANDINLTNSPSSIVKYLVEGGIGMFWPEAADPDHFSPREVPFKYDVSFVGACYGQRPAYVNYLRRHGVKVEAFGPGWPNGPMHEADMARLYSESRINLGFSGIGYSMEEVCLKGRDFEVPMCGAVYLTSHNPDLKRVYEIGREVVTYRDRRDCLEKVRELLADSSRCENIRRAARLRCEREHTWERRFEDLFDVMGILVPAERFQGEQGAIKG